MLVRPALQFGVTGNHIEPGPAGTTPVRSTEHGALVKLYPAVALRQRGEQSLQQILGPVGAAQTARVIAKYDACG
jgi:hypothetical protein